MMGQLDGEKAQAEQTAASSRGRRSAGLDAKDEAAYTRGAKPGMDEGEEPQSVFPSQNKPSKEDELRTALEDKYNQILGMTDEQKSAFVSTDEYEKYQDDWEALEKLLGTAAYEQYRKELFGGGKESDESAADISLEDFFDRGTHDETGPILFLPNETEYHDSLQKDYGIVDISGNETPVFVWNGNYPEYSEDQVLQQFSASVTNFDYGSLALNGLDGEEDAPGWFQLMQFAEQIAESFEGTDIVVDVVSIEGETVSIIKWFDSSYDNIEPGKANYTENGYFELDGRHNERREFGYVFLEDGKLMLKALVYPEDRFQYNGKDVTKQMATTPRELNDKEIEIINKAFEEMGIKFIY